MPNADAIHDQPGATADATPPSDALAGFRTLLHQARDIVLVLRPDGRIVDVNRAAVEAYGFDRDALLRLRIHDLRETATAGSIAEQLARADRDGIDFETCHRRRDGTTFPVEVSCRGADLGGDRLLLSVIRDLTERRRAEADRKRWEERIGRLQALTAALSKALDRGQVAAVIVEQAGATLGANAAVVAALSDDGRFFETLRLVGYPPEHAARMQRVPVDAPLMFAEAIRRGEPVFVETWAERVERYGHVAHIAIEGGNGAGMALPLLIEGKTIGAVGFAFPTDRSIDPEERDFVRAIADLCAQALERARLHEAEQRARAAAESARRRAVAAQRQLEAVLEPLPALVAYVDAQHRYRFVNRTFEEWFGVDREAAAGRPVRDVLGEELYAGLRPQIERVLAGERVTFEGQLTDRAGGLRYVQATYVPDIGEPGEVRGYVSLVSDLTARKAAEEERDALLARERQLNEAERAARRAAERAAARTAVLQAVTAALAEALTPDQVAAVAVEQGVAALGARAGVVVLLSSDGQELAVLRADGYPPGAIEPWQRFPLEAPVPIAEAVRTGTPVWLPSREVAYERYPPLASTRHELSEGALVSIPLVVEGRTIGALGLSFAGPQTFTPEDRDLALALAGQCAQALERARLYAAEAGARAAAEAAVRARDLFLSSTSHDLRTPLATIKGQAQLLRLRSRRTKQFDFARLEEGLTTIETNAARMAALIDELMDVGRLQIGQDLTLHRQPTDLVGLVSGCAGEFRARSPRHDVRVDAAVPSLVVDVDKGRIERVLANLLANAIKYSPEGGEVTVRVAAEGGGDGERGSKRWATISVQDRGIGISAQDLPRLFEPFFRGANAVARVAGSGIGLSGSGRIVELHGGSIEVESREGEGSTFTVRLPIDGSGSSRH